MNPSTGSGQATGRTVELARVERLLGQKDLRILELEELVEHAQRERDEWKLQVERLHPGTQDRP